ncbi:MAG: hypothetical protein Q8R28_06730, partial [Dehalococcoidia bacterium]|nr:hypothetical protein [Dehalococcoidia bacterium]
MTTDRKSRFVPLKSAAQRKAEAEAEKLLALKQDFPRAPLAYEPPASFQAGPQQPDRFEGFARPPLAQPQPQGFAAAPQEDIAGILAREGMEGLVGRGLASDPREAFARGERPGPSIGEAARRIPGGLAATIAGTIPAAFEAPFPDVLQLRDPRTGQPLRRGQTVGEALDPFLSLRGYLSKGVQETPLPGPVREGITRAFPYELPEEDKAKFQPTIGEAAEFVGPVDLIPGAGPALRGARAAGG